MVLERSCCNMSNKIKPGVGLKQQVSPCNQIKTPLTLEMWNEYIELLKEGMKKPNKKFEFKIPYQLKDVWEEATLDWINKNK